jgi:hypothetical protein
MITGAFWSAGYAIVLVPFAVWWFLGEDITSGPDQSGELAEDRRNPEKVCSLAFSQPLQGSRHHLEPAFGGGCHQMSSGIGRSEHHQTGAVWVAAPSD